MMLKSCIGDRALGWDLLPPGAKGFEYTDSKNQSWTYAGYHQSPMKWAGDFISSYSAAPDPAF
jgi:hypothetical protein